MMPRLLLATVALSVVVAAAAFKFPQTAQVNSADLAKVLGLTPDPQYHLYSGAISESTGKPLVLADRKVDLFDAGAFSPSASYETDKDRSSMDTKFTTTGALAEKYAFYPDDDGLRHLHVQSGFFADEKLKNEDVRHLDGTKEQQTNVIASGEKHVVRYAKDGLTVLDEIEYVPNSCCADLIVKSEMRYREGDKHLLEHSDVLNGDDTRSIVEYDEHRNVVRTETRPAGPEIEGAVITVFDPKTLKKQLVSRTKGEFDTVDYLRFDNTLERQVKVNEAAAEVTFFDSTGKKPLFVQKYDMLWSNDIRRRTISNIVEFDEKGDRVRELVFRYDEAAPNLERVILEIKFDVTVGGVKYARESLAYDELGFLKETRYVLHGTDNLYWLSQKPDLQFENTPTDKIRAVLSSSEELPLEVDPTLPLPKPEPHYGH